MNAITTALCALNRRQTLRRLMSKLPWVWRIDRPITKALQEARVEALQRLPKGSTCAELGVWKGDFAAEILRVTEPKILHLVDPWESQPTHVHYPHEDQKRGDDLYAAVCDRFRSDHRVQVHRMPALAFLATCQEQSLDWVYLDADHRELAVAADLRACWPVLKKGGWLVGDDYFWQDPSGQRSVQAAVKQFCRERHVAWELIGGQYLIHKP